MQRSIPFSHIVVTAIIALALATVALAPAQRKAHYPEATEEVFLRFSFKLENVVKILDVPVNLLSPMIPCEPDQAVKLPGGFPEIDLKEFLPRAELEQRVEPDPTGKAPPVITLSIRGPKLSYERRLAANDPARSRMQSIIASWQYLWEPDEKKRQTLYEEFETALTRGPAVIVRPADGSASMRLPVKGAIETGRRLPEFIS